MDVQRAVTRVIGRPLEELRERLRGRTQRELAREFGVCEQLMSLVLNEHRAPTKRILAGLGYEKIVMYKRIKS